MGKRTPHQKLMDRCDDLYRNIIYLNAGYRSEVRPYLPGRQLVGESGHILDAHHIAKKPNLALRYEIRNGICLTQWEHIYGIHGKHEERYRREIKRVRGKDIYDELEILRVRITPDLRLVETYLEEELRKAIERFKALGGMPVLSVKID